MILELATVVGLAQQCAPSVAVETLVSVVHTESHFNPYAIGVNAKGVAAPNPSDRVSAAAAARSLIARGYNIDLGLGQINSANLRWLGLSVDDAFDPCRNLAAAARVLASNYLNVVRSSPSTEVAIATAMSMYNTGSRSRGFGNGYVGRVYASSNVVVPAIRRRAMPEPAALPAPVSPEPKFTQRHRASARRASKTDGTPLQERRRHH
ncbi:lytic transglycosylase domain-containing protein [Novosphingobium sp. Leaf2]|uniref:lytic transglycosylase domain-containing protein n=1 Tax=Novosphingobium sp. Leaf2 TaxID=1735670 RepID=UPI000A63CE02|nr:lytic transglycosylase domain-containing protein [Novosphingobium sp. Leaf2]